jgi:hypothetical protein
VDTQKTWLKRLPKAAVLAAVLMGSTTSMWLREPAWAAESAAESVAESKAGEVYLARVSEKMEPVAGSALAHPVRNIEPTYKVQIGLSNEIFPVFANHAALQDREQRTWGTVAVTVNNFSDRALRERVTVEVPGWSQQEIQIAEMAAGDIRTLLFAPTFLPRLYRNQEIAAASVVVNVSDVGGKSVFSETYPIRLRAADDMYWGEHFKFAPFIASWVTPHDPRVEMVLGRAKEFVPGRRLPGYEDWKGAEDQGKATWVQVRAIYRALQEKGVSYVKSSLTFGENTNVSERIRMPRESLRESSANCIDGVVMYASLFENLGMEPVVVLVPGHAYVGVRLAPGSKQYLYLDTALTGRAGFDAAVAAAEHGLAHYPQAQITYIRVAEARRAGIFPMPESFASDFDYIPLQTASQAQPQPDPNYSAPDPASAFGHAAGAPQH